MFTDGMSLLVLVLLHSVTKACFFFFVRENTYVRIFGHLKSFKENSRSLIAFGLSPVTDFNEITYHMLDVVHSHLALSKVRPCVFCFCFFNSLVMKLGSCCRKSTSLFYDMYTL